MNTINTTLPVRASGLSNMAPVPGSKARVDHPDAVELSGLSVAAATDEEPEAPESPWARVAQGGALLCSLIGAGIAAPAMAQAQTVPAQAATFTQPNVTYGNIHVTAHIDATESIISPIASNEVNMYEKMKAAGGDQVTAEVAVVRNYNPNVKAAKSLGCFAITLAPTVGAAVLAKKKGDSRFIRASIVGLGMALTGYVGVSQGFALDGLKNGISAYMDYSAQEPGWDGYRMYEVKPDQTPGFESQVVGAQPDVMKPSVETASDFLARNLGSHKDQMNVVLLTGHGLAYRHSAGFSFEDYQKMLKQAVEKSGRPIDLLVVESCLVGNTEFLAGTAPYARYALVSEDVVSAGSLPTALAKAVASPDGKELTPEQLGQRIIEASRGDRGISTLALVDLSKMQGLDQSIDKLGSTLAQQVQSGDRQAVLKAMDGTKLYPENEPLLGDQAKLLQYGDLNNFLQRLHEQFEKSSSPQKAQVLSQIEAAQGALSQLVVGNQAAGAANAMSIQLPAAHFQKLEERLAERVGMSLFKNSAAPEGWKQFVSVTSDVMKQAKEAQAR